MCQTGANIWSKVGGKVTHPESNAILESSYLHRSRCGFNQKKPQAGCFLMFS